MSKSETVAAEIENSQDKRRMAIIEFTCPRTGLGDLELVSKSPSRVAGGLGYPRGAEPHTKFRAGLGTFV
jgi:hypothetical protein